MSARAPSWAAIREIFLAFLGLGLTSFGGPVAHIGYFRDAFVVRRRWLDDHAFSELVAMCQFLPGPASSQVGFALGLIRGGGLAGGLVAWFAFTMPSALVLVLCARGAGLLQGTAALGVVHGLKLVAVAVVAHAVWSMARALAPDLRRRLIALLAGALAVMLPGGTGQLAALATGALAGLAACRPGTAGAVTPPGSLSRVPLATFALALFLLLLAIALVLPPGQRPFEIFGGFYRAGALVFGGGHVVLPLLQAEWVQAGYVDDATFVAGYGLAQAVPGPLFTFAAYLGASLDAGAHGWRNAGIALVAVFLPGLLLVYGVLPRWQALRRIRGATAVVQGLNAAVIGILASALYDPLWTGSVRGVADVMLVVAGFLGLAMGRLPPWGLVLALAGIGAILGVS